MNEPIKLCFAAVTTWKDPVVDGRIILRCVLWKWDVGAWTGSMWLRIGTGGGNL